MIKARFLRIGNFVTDVERRILTISSVSKYQILIEEDNIAYQPGDLNGIELTQDGIINALKFEKESFEQHWLLERRPFVLMPFIMSGEIKGWHCYIEDSKKKLQTLRTIKYVHQLQNIWSVLSDKELFINKGDLEKY